MINRKRILKTFIIVIVLLPITIWFSALLKCDILTLLHGNEFKDNYSEHTMIGDIDYLKILNYSYDFASVYYVSANKTGGNVVTFLKKDEKWIFKNWRTVWSATGSASDVIWPYWWHFIYGGL